MLDFLPGMHSTLCSFPKQLQKLTSMLHSLTLPHSHHPLCSECEASLCYMKHHTTNNSNKYGPVPSLIGDILRSLFDSIKLSSSLAAQYITESFPKNHTLLPLFRLLLLHICSAVSLAVAVLCLLMILKHWVTFAQTSVGLIS